MKKILIILNLSSFCVFGQDTLKKDTIPSKIYMQYRSVIEDFALAIALTGTIVENKRFNINSKKIILKMWNEYPILKKEFRNIVFRIPDKMYIVDSIMRIDNKDHYWLFLKPIHSKNIKKDTISFVETWYHGKKINQLFVE